jgi:hypothetical protein
MYGKVLSRGSLKMLRMYHWGGALQFWKASPSRPSPIHKVGREGGNLISKIFMGYSNKRFLYVWK